jgi:digeranylgeranylglycerophospholipid reductase
MKYDLAIIGGGPAGLMAARTAAAERMKTVLFERHRNPLQPRLDASMFYFNFLTPEVYVEPVDVTFWTGARMEEAKRVPPKITFNFRVPDFTLDYSGPAILQYHYLNLSPGGHRVYGIKDELWSFYFSRETLLNNLFTEAVRAGAEIRSGQLATNAENVKDGVVIRLKGPGSEETLKADYVIAADGLDSAIVAGLGLNRDRPSRGHGKFVSWVFDGVTADRDIRLESTWLSFNYPSVSPMGLTLSPYFENGNTGLKQLMAVSDDAIEKFIRETRYAEWFRQAHVLRKMAIAVDVRPPLKEVVHGRILLAGDSSGGMTGIMGAIASGYQAVKAILKESKEKQGFNSYSGWFFQAFACYVCHEHDKRRLMHRLLRRVCSDDEVDYIFQRLEGRVCHPAFVVFDEPDTLSERPDLHQKVMKIAREIDNMPLTF